MKWNPNSQAAEAPGTGLLSSPGEKSFFSSKEPFHGGLKIYFKEINVTLQTSRNTHMESATTSQTSHHISRESIIFSSYGSIWDHFHLSFYVQMCMAGSLYWTLCSGGCKDPTALIVSSYEEISSILRIRKRGERDRFSLWAGAWKCFHF